MGTRHTKPQPRVQRSTCSAQPSKRPWGDGCREITWARCDAGVSHSMPGLYLRSRPLWGSPCPTPQSGSTLGGHGGAMPCLWGPARLPSSLPSWPDRQAVSPPIPSRLLEPANSSWMKGKGNHMEIPMVCILPPPRCPRGPAASFISPSLVTRRSRPSFIIPHSRQKDKHGGPSARRFITSGK